MRKSSLVILFLLSLNIFAANKVALVIGNKDYRVSPLKNPLNDSEDMAATLKSLGFQVTLKTNIADNKEMVKAINDFTSKMSNQGLFVFYYSGHGIQYNGKNYLVPTSLSVNDETDIEFGCLDVDRLLAKCENYSNNTNIVILDACRDNPFTSASRSSSKGLAIVGKSPGGTLIAYSTSPGKTASDGSGRNGLYTQELLKAIKKPGLEVEDAFKEVRRNVKQLSGGAQVPWESSSLEESISFSGLVAANTRVYEKETVSQPVVQKQSNNTELPQIDMIFVQGGTFNMGSNESDDEKPIHSVTVSDFYIGKYEVTWKEWNEIMSDYHSTNDGMPRTNMSWGDCQEFIRKLNSKTGKKYRLPTEAEWEFAARGGNKSNGYKYSGSNDLGSVGWYGDNSSSKTHPVGTKQANELGIYDMTGNVWEWCSDWYGSYNSSSKTNPQGASYGSMHVVRGGSFCDIDYCGVSCRVREYPYMGCYLIGLRLAMNY